MKQIFIIMLLLCTHLITAQTIIIQDESTLQGLQGVTIGKKGSSDFLISDQKGMVDISSLANEGNIEIKFLGYKPIELSYADLSNTSKVLLKESTRTLEDVIVSANKFDENSNDVAQPIQVLSAKELGFMNQQTTADVLQQSGSVLVQKSQLGGGSPIIRGFEANKVLMVVDGVRMNNAIYRGGHLQNAITIDNTMLDKMEIIFGPGAVVYGSDALGGVMHFYTKKPILASGDKKSFVGANAFTRYSTAYNERTGHIDFNIGFKKLAFLTSATYSNFDDLKQGGNRPASYGDWGKRTFYAERINGKDSMVNNADATLQKKTGYQQFDVLQKILFEQSSRVSHLLNVQYSTTSDINRYDRLTVVSSGLPKYAEWYYGPQKRLLTSYTLNLTGANMFYDKSRLILAYQNIGESRHDRKFDKISLNHRTEEVNVYSANLDLSKNITDKQELRYGAEFLYNTVNSTAEAEDITTGKVSALDTRYPDGGSTMQTIALYATHAWEISKKLILNDGIRFSNVTLNSKFVDKTFFPLPYDNISQNYNALNGNLGLIYMPGRDLRFSVIGSSGFRAPNVDDMTKVFESTKGKLIIPNSKLEPEYTYNLELGVSKVFSKRVKIETSTYYTWYVNALTTKKTTLNGADSVMYDGVNSAVYTLKNTGEAYVYGVNLGLYVDILSSLSFYSTFNYTYGRIKTDSSEYPLDHIAPIFGKAGFKYTRKKLKAEVFTLYNGDKLTKDYNLQGEDNEDYSLDDVDGKSPAWYTLNVRMAYQLNAYVQLDFALENIMDSYYRVFASGVSGAGRNLVLTLRGRF